MRENLNSVEVKSRKNSIKFDITVSHPTQILKIINETFAKPHYLI